MAGFDEVWQRIVALCGETFYQKSGKPFTYAVSGNSLKPSTTNRQLPRSHFDRAFAREPLDGPGQLQDLQGPSYLFAILTNPRITADRPGATASRAGVGSGNQEDVSHGRPAAGALAQDAGSTARPGIPASAVRLPAPGDLRQIDPRRVLLAVPCSAAKRRGGLPPGDARQEHWPEGLRTARGRVLANAEADMARQMPAWRRYDGMFYRYASAALHEAAENGNVVIISGGYGVARAQELIGWYEKPCAWSTGQPACWNRPSPVRPTAPAPALWWRSLRPPPVTRSCSAALAGGMLASGPTWSPSPVLPAGRWPRCRAVLVLRSARSGTSSTTTTRRAPSWSSCCDRHTAGGSRRVLPAPGHTGQPRTRPPPAGRLHWP
jgi:hypothetical protein